VRISAFVSLFNLDSFQVHVSPSTDWWSAMSSDKVHVDKVHVDNSPAAAKARFEQLNAGDDGRLPFILTWAEVKLLGIAGVSLSFLVQLSTTSHISSQGWLLPGRWVLALQMIWSASDDRASRL
jgi:hypothetical protein